MFQVTVPIIRRNNCIYATLGTCYSVWMTGWYVGAYAPASITCFRWLCAYHQEKQLYLCDTCYLLFCMDDCLVCRVEFHSTLCTRQSFIQNFSWCWAHSHPKHIEKRNIKTNVCTKLALFTRLYRDACSTEHKIRKILFGKVIFRLDSFVSVYISPLTLIKSAEMVPSTWELWSSSARIYHVCETGESFVCWNDSFQNNGRRSHSKHEVWLHCIRL